MFHADNLWCGVEGELGTEIVHRVGILEMDAPGYDHAKRARASAEKNGVDFEWIDAPEIRKRWPAFEPPEGWEGGYSPIAGFLDVEAGPLRAGRPCLRGEVTFRTEEPVLGWKSSTGGVASKRRKDAIQRKADRDRGLMGDRMLAELGLPLDGRSQSTISGSMSISRRFIGRRSFLSLPPHPMSARYTASRSSAGRASRWPNTEAGKPRPHRRSIGLRGTKTRKVASTWPRSP